MVRLLAFLSLFTYSSSAIAAVWTKLGIDANGVTAYFDGTSYRKVGSLRYYHIKYVLPQADHIGMIYTVRDEVIDCDKRTIKTLIISGFRSDDSLIAIVPLDEVARKVEPRSNGEEMVRGLCNL